MANVIYTIKGNHFSQWVDQRIKERNDKIKAQGGMMINMDPEVASIFT